MSLVAFQLNEASQLQPENSRLALLLGLAAKILGVLIVCGTSLKPFGA